MSIHARKWKDGRVVYDVRLRDPGGRQYKRTFATKREARDFEARERADHRRGTWIDPRAGDITLAEWARHWRDANLAKRSSTRARDESILRLHVLPALGSRRINSIRPADVRALVADWDRRYAPRTVRRHYDVLRALLNSAVEADRIGRTPCRGVKLPKPEPARRHIVDAADLARLAAALPPDLAPMVYLGAVLGLRWGECAGLRVGRLDFLRGTIAVDEQVTRGMGGRVVEGPPKSKAGERTMSAPQWLMSMLARLLHRRGLSGVDTEARVFPGPDGGPLRYSNWRQRKWLPATRAAGLKGLQFRNLRTANATVMVAEGVDVRTAQARLGHSDPSLTLEVYAQATTDADRAAAERLGDHFRPPEVPDQRAAMGGGLDDGQPREKRRPTRRHRGDDGGRGRNEEEHEP